jgi:hypothetical protein
MTTRPSGLMKGVTSNSTPTESWDYWELLPYALPE